MGMQPLGFDGKLDNHWDSPWHKARFVYVTMLLTMLTGTYLGTHDIYDMYDIYDIYDIYYIIYIIYMNDWPGEPIFQLNSC